jgi:hypothetical protein
MAAGEPSSVLDIAERLDGYLTAIQKSPTNTAARRDYAYEMDSVGPDAAASIAAVAATIPLLKSIGAELVILNSTADGGMPHTRAPNLICLPASLANSKELRTTLIHEAIHIHQRLHPDLWRSALIKAGWSPQPATAVPSALKERIRINPDTLACPFWAWESRLIPLPLFSVTNPTLGSASIEWYDVKTGALFRDPPVPFRNDEKGALEHPYELFAYRLSNQGIDTEGGLTEALSL